MTLILAVALIPPIFLFSRTESHYVFIIAAMAAGIYLLLVPAAKLFRSKNRRHAMDIFNRASYYPLVLLGVALIKVLLKG